MTKEESLKLFRYFQQEFTKLNKRLDTTDGRIEKLLVLADKTVADFDAIFAEQNFNTVRVASHQSWITKASKKIGIPYRRAST